MKRTILSGLGLSLLAATQLLGCAEPELTGEEDLPGDIDNAPAGGGKADGWDAQNNPAVMAQQLEYRLAKLPLKGKLDKPVWAAQYPEAVGKAAPIWADTYWPTGEGSHNARWQGASVKSPLEKYDAAYNNAPGCATYPDTFCGPTAKAKWDAYNQCAGPAAKWQTTVFQGGGDMHDGVDNDRDGKVDECAGEDSDGIQGWWGTCHAWTPASMLVPEPQHEVTVNGVTFGVGDIKALIQNAFDSTSAVMLGGRCNGKEIKHDVNGSANDDCADVNPGALHVIMTNFRGLKQLPLVEDRTANYEVWNQPVYGYEITKQDLVTAADANKCVGNTGDTWTYNSKAKKLYEVRMTVTYIGESYASNTPVGFEDNQSTDSYHYILEVGSYGKVIGGRFCTDAENRHIDFLWSPTGQWRPSNPNVNVAKIKELIAKSVAPITTGGGTGTGAHKTFSATPHAAIPDNSPAGVKVDVPVAGVAKPAGLTVSVDIAHTYRGDLTVDLLKNGTLVKTLAAKTGGSADNIVESYTLGADLLGASVDGTWSLKVVDGDAQDTGTVNSVTLDFATN